MALTELGKAVVEGRYKPNTDGDMTFKVALCSELLYAWQDAGKAARRSLERVMNNVGMDHEDDDRWYLTTQSGGRYLVR